MTPRTSLRDLIPYLAIGFFFVVQLFPLIWVISASLQTPEALAHGPSNKLWPSSFYIGNYVRAFTTSPLLKYLLKKLPLILEEKVLPKLAEKDVPARVTQALEGTATTLGGGDEGGARDEKEPVTQQESTKEKPAEQAPDSDREAERRKREQRRQQRKRDLERAA